MTVFTVTVVVLRVIVIVMLFMSRLVAVVLVFKAEGQSGLVPGCHVQPVLFLQLPSDLVPLCLQLSQSSSDKLLLWEKGGGKIGSYEGNAMGMSYVVVNLLDFKSLSSIAFFCLHKNKSSKLAYTFKLDWPSLCVLKGKVNTR